MTCKATHAPSELPSLEHAWRRAPIWQAPNSTSADGDEKAEPPREQMFEDSWATANFARWEGESAPRNALLLFVVLLLGLASAVTFARDVTPASIAHQANEPIRVIFDTDIWSDIDDMLALAMLHALQARHEVDLVAVTISTGDPWCASYVDLVNTFYGHPRIPVGIIQIGENFTRGEKSYPDIIAERRTSSGAPLYPHRLVDGRLAPDAVSLLRKTLAAQPDGSVVVVEVGYSTNLARLLNSKSDSVSSESGRDLVAKKVRLLSVMAGNFHESEFEGKTFPKGAPESNLQGDVLAAQNVFSNWPTPIVDSGLEIGLAMRYPGQSVSHDYSYVENHPIADTYRTYCNEQRAQNPEIRRCPEDHDHATCDLTAVLYAARPDGKYFSLSKPGKITVLPDGGSRFEETSESQHRYLILNDAQKARTLEAMVMLASQPPAHIAHP